MFEAEHQTRSLLRRRQILLELTDEPMVSVTALARAYGVSEMTIRRDLSALAASGEVRKVHGGAVRATDSAASVRLSKNREVKEAMAEAADRLVPDGATVFLDAGTSVAALAHRLGTRPVILVTQSLLVIDALGRDPIATVYLIGGKLRASTASLVGASMIAELENFRADFAFIGASAVDENGFYNHNVEDVAIQRKQIEIADVAWLLADSSKFTARAAAKVASLSALAGVISDDHIDPALADAIRTHVLRLDLVHASAAPRAAVLDTAGAGE